MTIVQRFYLGVTAVCLACAAAFFIVWKIESARQRHVFGGVFSMTKMSYRNARGSVGTIHIIRIPRSSAQVTIEHDEAQPHFVSEWGKMATSSVVINGGYFDEDFQPSGLLFVAGKRIGAHAFDQERSGLVTITSGTVAIRDLFTQPLKPDEQFDYALQSYPFLIKQHALAIPNDSGKRARRSAIAEDDFGNVFLLVADAPDLSLYEFMKIVSTNSYNFSMVLNLDGGPSTGVSIRSEQGNFEINSESTIPHILRVTPHE